MASHQEGPVRCPTCKAEVLATVRQLIAADDLAVKAAFVQGRLHEMRCRHCDTVFTPPVPTLYYDLAQGLALVLTPAGPGRAGARDVRELTQALRLSVPPERLAPALLQPQRFITRGAMVKAILAADGLTEEVLRAQAARAGLLQELLQAPDEAALRELARAHDAELDEGFFELLTAQMQAAHVAGDHEGAQTLLAFRTFLGRCASRGAAAIAALDERLGLEVIPSREALLAKLRRAAGEEERAALVARGHVLLDARFFQLLDAEADRAAAAGDGAAARELVRLRAAVEVLRGRHEASARADLERAAALFAQVVGSPQPDAVLAQNRTGLDEAFFVVLGANLERARRQGQHEPARALELLGRLARSVAAGV